MNNGIFWVFVTYGHTKETAGNGILKAVADNEQMARDTVEKFLKSQGYEFILVTEVIEG